MSPDVEHALALWRAYDLAVIENRLATAAAFAASKTFHPPKSRRRALSPEARASITASLRAADAKGAARDAFHAIALVFDETANEGRSADELSPVEPPVPTAIGTREPVRICTFGGEALWHSTPASCGPKSAPGE